MLRHRIVWFGRAANDGYEGILTDYLQRIGRYAPIEIHRYRDHELEAAASGLRQHGGRRWHVVVLDREGRELSTDDFAGRIDAWRNTSTSVTYVIGPADGLSPGFRAQADECWSLSQLTMAHRLATVVLCEQIYRCHTILRGERYHRGPEAV